MHYPHILGQLKVVVSVTLAHHVTY